jgi:threonine/homoserine/homoserine lactone efflux protein
MSETPQGPNWFKASDGRWYPPAPPTVAASSRTSGLAIASLVLGIVWVYWIGSILAVIFAHIALRNMKRDPSVGGKGMAIAGLVLGYVGVGILALLFLVGFITGFMDGFNEYN